jgi:hypothetical protein
MMPIRYDIALGMFAGMTGLSVVFGLVWLASQLLTKAAQIASIGSIVGG